MTSGGAQGHNRATIRIQTRISLRSTRRGVMEIWHQAEEDTRAQSR
jgi:hypothetical protein